MTVGGYSGSSTLANFPLLVKISPSVISGFGYSQCAAGGADISFALEDGTVLPHEVDTWNTDGESLVWVKVPSISGTTTKFKFRWNDPVPAANDATAVWSEYVGVWHLGETDAATETNAVDSTGHGFTATIPNKSETELCATKAAKIGNGRWKPKTTMTVPRYDSQNAGGTFTASGWFYMDERTTYESFFGHKEAWDKGTGWQSNMQNHDTQFFCSGSGSKNAIKTFSTSVNGRWLNLALVFNGTSMQPYDNGTVVSGGAVSINAAGDNERPLYVGGNIKGTLDEIRIRKAASSADWVKAEYEQVTKANYVTAGEIEVLDTKGIMIRSSLGQEYGTVSPAYGSIAEPVAGQEYVFTCTQTEEMLDENRTKAVCTGWKLKKLADGSLVKSSSDEGESAFECRHTYVDGVGVDLEWQWVIRHRVLANALGGGSVDKPEQWIKAGESATVTATAADGMKFAAWSGDVQSTERVLTIENVSKPLTIAATFTPADATIVVPSDDDYVNITNAIAQAKDGGTVQLVSGTYRPTNAISIARNVTLRGAARNDTIIDLQGKCRGFYLTNSGATVRDLTIYRGTTRYGGGVYMTDGLVSNCLVQSCWVASGDLGTKGGGVYMTNGKVLDCEFTGCRFDNLYGAGNAIYMEGGTVSECDIHANNGGYDHSNASYGSHGVYIKGGTLRNSKIYKNATNLAGIKQEGGTVVNCLVTGNTSGKNAAGIYKTNGYTYYCTVYGNVMSTDSTGCSGIRQTGGTTMYCISYGNGPANSSAGSNRITGGTFKSNVIDVVLGSYSLNKVIDPLFVDAENGDFHIASRASPAYGYGAPLASSPTDLEGLVRNETAPTSGCYEYDKSKEAFSADIKFEQSDYCEGSSVTAEAVIGGAEADEVTIAWYVDGVLQSGETGDKMTVSNLSNGRHSFKIRLTRKIDSAVAEKDCTDAVDIRPFTCYVSRTGSSTYPYDSWEKATTSLNDAVAAVWQETARTTTVHVASGAYTNNATITLSMPVRILGADRETTFAQYASGRAFQLAHAGCEISGLTARNSKGGFSISSGRLHDCRASGTGGAGNGGGFLVSGGTVWNCEAKSCWAQETYTGGGGFYITGGTVSNVLSHGCWASYDSYNHGCCGSVYLKVGLLVDATISGTSMREIKGSAIRTESGTLLRCKVIGNKSTSAHAVYLQGVTARNCLFAQDVGGTSSLAPVYVSGSTLENCTFAGNTNSASCLSAYSVTAVNTIFEECGGGTNIVTGTINNCLAQSPLPSGENNIIGDPKFYSRKDKKWRIKSTSPALDAGKKLYWMTDTSIDLDHTPRARNLAPDMGCYEGDQRGVMLIVQ